MKTTPITAAFVRSHHCCNPLLQPLHSTNAATSTDRRQHLPYQELGLQDSVNLVRDATCWQCEHEWRQDIAVVTKWLSGMYPVRAAYLFGVDACYPNPKASECHINVKVPDTSVGQNWKFSLQMESYDIVVLDSRLSIEDFRTQSNQILDSFTANSYDAENSEGVEHLEANDISSVADQIETGCTPFPLATCPQPLVLVGDSNYTLTSSMEQNTLTKEQENTEKYE